jgi:hypothetical protein
MTQMGTDKKNELTTEGAEGHRDEINDLIEFSLCVPLRPQRFIPLQLSPSVSSMDNFFPAMNRDPDVRRGHDTRRGGLVEDERGEAEAALLG